MEIYYVCVTFIRAFLASWILHCLNVKHKELYSFGKLR